MKQIDAFKYWLQVEENREIVKPESKISILVSQLDSHVVSFKAGNVFPITYGVLANVS